VELSAT